MTSAFCPKKDTVTSSSTCKILEAHILPILRSDSSLNHGRLVDGVLLAC
jgi:hypothetical protein